MTNEAFKTSLERVIKAEGGYQLTNIPNDQGGPTYAGISKNDNPDWAGWEYLKNKDYRELQEEVESLYRQKYWDPVVTKLGIEDPMLAHTLFSQAVNMGPLTVINLLRSTLGISDGVSVTKELIDKIANENPAHIVSNFKLACIARYSAIVAKNPTQIKFLRGWINRIQEN